MVGRSKEVKTLEKLYTSNKSQFIAIYGRRRVGKTYLVNELFDGKFTFKHSGLSPVEDEDSNSLSPMKRQLKHFYNSLLLHGMKKSSCPENWMDAFLMLELFLQEKDDGSRQLVFIDELPWLDTPKSGFISAFEGFWNTWACSRKNLMLIVCGSATSWISNNLINNHGGLYNRLTYEMKLSPFTLEECEEYFKAEGIEFSRYDIVQSYMITGGIPYYLSYFKRGLSLAQNIDELFFANNAPLKDEFDRLFKSIFVNSVMMSNIIHGLSKNRYGMTKKEISEKLKICQGGTLTNALNALIASDFIEKYKPFACKDKSEYFRLKDPFCIFYIKFIEKNDSLDSNFWIDNVSSQNIVSWRGIAFENVCFNHIEQIKSALGILGVGTKQSAWVNKDDISGTQIDMIIDRKDNIVNMCEIKFYNGEFIVDKSYEKIIRDREKALRKEISLSKTIHSTLITSYGLRYNEHSGTFAKVICMDDLFRKI